MTSRRALLVALLAIFCLAANRGPIVITGAGWGGQPVPSGTPTATPTPSPTASATPTAAPEPGELFWFTDWEDADETNCDGDNATWVDADCQGGSYNGRYATGAIEGNYSGRSTTSTNNWAMSGKDVAVPHDDAYADFYWKAIAHDSGTSKRIVTMSNDATSWLCSLNVDHVSAGVLDMQMRVANGSGVGSAYTGADNTDYQIRIVMDKVDSDGALGGHFDCTVLIDPDGGTWGAGALFSHTVYATEYTGSGTGITHVEHYGHSGGWDSLIDGIGLCALPAVPGTRCAPGVGPTPTATPGATPTATSSATPTATATPTDTPPTPTATPLPVTPVVLCQMDWEGTGCADTGGETCNDQGAGYTLPCETGDSYCPIGVAGTKSYWSSCTDLYDDPTAGGGEQTSGDPDGYCDYDGAAQLTDDNWLDFLNDTDCPDKPNVSAEWTFTWAEDKDWNGTASHEIMGLKQADAGQMAWLYIRENQSPTEDPSCSPNCGRMTFVCGPAEGDGTAYWNIELGIPYNVRVEIDSVAGDLSCKVWVDTQASGDWGQGGVFSETDLLAVGEAVEVGGVFFYNASGDQSFIVDDAALCDISSSGSLGNQPCD
jgi:hypothetical protein